MYISHLVIQNFRALAEIDFDLGPRINVIVGPNAVGKTTILQAVRLANAVTAPRTQQEAQQVLISLGAASPHFPQRLFLNSLARDLSKPIEVRCTYALSDEEIATLLGSVPEIGQSIVASRSGQAFVNPAALIQFFQSPAGRQAISDISNEVSSVLNRLERDRSLVLGVTLNGLTGQISAPQPLAGR
jgi:energy-coupling factor transporter ATP-binding protein EcfA2